MIHRAIKSGVGITYHDVKEGRIGWGDINRANDMADLEDWVDWEARMIAEEVARRK